MACCPLETQWYCRPKPTDWDDSLNTTGIGSSTAAFPFSVLWREYAQVARWQCTGNNAEMEVASGGQTMSVLRRGRGRCVGRFPVLLVPWQFFRLGDAVRCIGHRSALHRLLQRAALGFAAHCVCLLSLLELSLHPLPVGLLASSGCSLGAVTCLFHCGRASPAVSFPASVMLEKSGRCCVAECGQRQLPVPVTVFYFMRKKCPLTCETRKKLYLCKMINVA